MLLASEKGLVSHRDSGCPRPLPGHAVPVMPETCRSTAMLLLDSFREADFERAVSGAFEQLGGPADLVFAFLSPDWLADLDTFLEVVQIGLRCPRVVGCTTNGLIGDSGEHESVGGCSLLALRLPGSTITVEKWPTNLNQNPENPAPAGGSGAILLANPVLVPTDLLVSRWRATHHGLPTFGAFISGGAHPETFALFTEVGLSDHGALAVHFAGGIRLDGALGHGCRTIGEARVISGVNGNVVTALAGDSPLQCLESALAKATEQKGVSPVIGPGLLHVSLTIAPDGLAPASPMDDMVVRAIIGADADTGAIAIAGAPRVGQTLRFCLRDAEAGSVWWHQSLLMARDRHESLPVAMLVFPCLGRGSEFFGIPDHDVSMVQNHLGHPPIAGLFANGELISHPVQLQAHTFSVVAAFFYPDTTQHG